MNERMEKKHKLQYYKWEKARCASSKNTHSCIIMHSSTLAFFLVPLAHTHTHIHGKKFRLCSLRSCVQLLHHKVHAYLSVGVKAREVEKRGREAKRHLSTSRVGAMLAAIKRMSYIVNIFEINHESNEKRIKLNIKRYIRANVMWFIAVKFSS